MSWVRVPRWVVDIALQEHTDCCSDFARQQSCKHNLYLQTLRDALGESFRDEDIRSREWRAKGFPR